MLPFNFDRARISRLLFPQLPVTLSPQERPSFSSTEPEARARSSGQDAYAAQVSQSTAPPLRVQPCPPSPECPQRTIFFSPLTRLGSGTCTQARERAERYMLDMLHVSNAAMRAPVLDIVGILSSTAILSIPHAQRSIEDSLARKCQTEVDSIPTLRALVDRAMAFGMSQDTIVHAVLHSEQAMHSW